MTVTRKRTRSTTKHSRPRATPTARSPAPRASNPTYSGSMRSRRAPIRSSSCRTICCCASVWTTSSSPARSRRRARWTPSSWRWSTKKQGCRSDPGSLLRDCIRKNDPPCGGSFVFVFRRPITPSRQHARAEPSCGWQRSCASHASQRPYRRQRR